MRFKLKTKEFVDSKYQAKYIGESVRKDHWVSFVRDLRNGNFEKGGLEYRVWEDGTGWLLVERGNGFAYVWCGDGGEFEKGIIWVWIKIKKGEVKHVLKKLMGGVTSILNDFERWEEEMKISMGGFPEKFEV